jgi:hypothetical protein
MIEGCAGACGSGIPEPRDKNKMVALASMDFLISKAVHFPG